MTVYHVHQSSTGAWQDPVPENYGKTDCNYRGPCRCFAEEDVALRFLEKKTDRPVPLNT